MKRSEYERVKGWTVPVTIRAERADMDRLDAVAAEREVTRSKLVKEILHEAAAKLDRAQG